MAKRMILMLVLMAVFIAALGFIKVKQFQAMAGQFAAMQPPPEAVTTIVAQQEHWPEVLSAIGTVAAVQGVTVSADLPGVVDRIAFESGRTVQQGDVLVELDTRQEQAQLAAAEAQLELARLNFQRMKGLVEQDAVSRAEYDNAAAAQKQAEARIREIRATIARKTIRAPFSGVLGIRQVNLGQYLSGGDPIVPLQSLNPIYVNFGVPQQDASRVRIGRSLRVVAGDLGAAEFTGRITAVDSVVDTDTRNVQVQATLANPGGRLRPGMFVQTELGVGATRAVIPLPASAISYAPYGDSVFVVTDLKNQDGAVYRGVRQQVVKLGASRGDQVAVVSGISPGDEVVTSGVFKLRNGAAVAVNNSVQPANSAAPTPEDK
ncbi:MAG TPA: efflux RND transporter periplasmic adaptor subunit [Vicinamibacterales bacterium]|nr:efflux RND transporter periplasmic adaptor subunit [Vicinamibacterales bacterium]